MARRSPSESRVVVAMSSRASTTAGLRGPSASALTVASETSLLAWVRMLCSSWAIRSRWARRASLRAASAAYSSWFEARSTRPVPTEVPKTMIQKIRTFPPTGSPRRRAIVSPPIKHRMSASACHLWSSVMRRGMTNRLLIDAVDTKPIAATGRRGRPTRATAAQGWRRTSRTLAALGRELRVRGSAPVRARSVQASAARSKAITRRAVQARAARRARRPGAGRCANAPDDVGIAKVTSGSLVRLGDMRLI